jgi:dipeptidase
MTKGLAAGPYGDPNRWDMGPRDNMTIAYELQGSFRRAISLFRTSYSFVAQVSMRCEYTRIIQHPRACNQGRSDKPDILARMWMCQYAPASSVFIPVYVAVSSLPKPWITGTQKFTSCLHSEVSHAIQIQMHLATSHTDIVHTYRGVDLRPCRVVLQV